MKEVFPVSDNLIKKLADDLQMVESTEVEIPVIDKSSVEK